MVALNIDRSVTGQPWRWRREPDPALAMDALIDELLLARGVDRDDLPRNRDPRIRDFLPDPSGFQDMDKGARRGSTSSWSIITNARAASRRHTP